MYVCVGNCIDYHVLYLYITTTPEFLFPFLTGTMALLGCGSLRVSFSEAITMSITTKQSIKGYDLSLSPVNKMVDIDDAIEALDAASFSAASSSVQDSYSLLIRQKYYY